MCSLLMKVVKLNDSNQELHSRQRVAVHWQMNTLRGVGGANRTAPTVLP